MSRGRRTRTDESKKWYLQMGYVAAAILALGYIAVTVQNSSGLAAGMASASFTIILGLVGLATYPALFKDSMYLSRSGYPYTPSWWKYVGFGVLAPVAIYYGGKVGGLGENSIAFAVIGFTLSTIIMNIAYLYNRHQHIGRP